MIEFDVDRITSRVSLIESKVDTIQSRDEKLIDSLDKMNENLVTISQLLSEMIMDSRNR